ncbi:hypothetical protein [Nannocystis bainbridge]|uniref:Myxococcus cysteine-rich repeat-containing protein n=1 Tax=Nannocystis bainbridge TaxID=2995303 RepID=A0ABT5E4D7_9BACT|nr:hypothetical protein [Nannocystis bainbridge]MDC0720600.1 hypothetical protein [Nannocystis bainbridge]
MSWGTYGCTGEDPGAPATTASEPGTTSAAPATTSEMPDGTESTGEAPTTTADDPGGTTSTSTGEAMSYCGDGAIDAGEACDDGPANADHGACTHQCAAAVCGDGFVRAGVEACDLGDGNSSEYGGCDGCQLAAHCGDGVVDEGFEVCDLGDLNGTGVASGEEPPCRAGCTWQGRLAFVTSQVYTGALGGLDGADIRCRDRAKAVGLANADTFRAWLSDGSQSPSSRFEQIDLQQVPYFLRNGRVIAADFAELVASGPRTGLSIDETGAMVTEEFVWTNTTGLGNVLHPLDHCDSWTSAAGRFQAMRGLNGLAVEMGPAWEAWRAERQWTVALSSKCNFARRLYCFEDGYVGED